MASSKISNLGSVKHHQTVNVIINPRTCDLDKTIGDILQISELISCEMPSAQMESITVKGHFAIAKVLDLAKGSYSQTTIRLYCINGNWKMRGSRHYAVDGKQNSKNRSKIIT